MQAQIPKLQVIILMLDANEFLHKTSLGEFATSLDLQDLHASTPAPTTCHSSTHGRINYMLGSATVVTSLIHNGTLSYSGEGLTSDHCCLFVDIDYVQLLQLDTVNHIIPPSR